MKIRTGYVSNSSSSSFIIACKQNEIIKINNNKYQLNCDNMIYNMFSNSYLSTYKEYNKDKSYLDQGIKDNIDKFIKENPTYKLYDLNVENSESSIINYIQIFNLLGVVETFQQHIFECDINQVLVEV